MKRFLLILLTVSLVSSSRGLTPAPAGTTPPDSITVRVTTFNVRYGTADDGLNSWQYRRDLFFDVLRKEHADIIGFQEALRMQLDAVHSMFPAYGEVGVGRDDGKSAGEHSQILYRLDRFIVDTCGTFWLSDTPEIPNSITWGNACTRICTWVRLVDRASLKGFYVFNTHLDHMSQQSREFSVQLIASRIATRKHREPVLLLGDLNADESNPVVPFIQGKGRLMTKDGPTVKTPQPLADTYRMVYPQDTAVKTYHGFEGGTVGEKIDYIFASAGCRTLEAGIDTTSSNGRYPSDHYPVWAVVRMSPSYVR